MGETTMVCGIKAEVAEPDISTPNSGFVGTSRGSPSELHAMLLNETFSSTQYRLTGNLFASL